MVIGKKAFPKGLDRYDWHGDGMANETKRIAALAGSKNIILYGFHESLPKLVKGLTSANIDHWIVISTVQHQRLEQKLPNQGELAIFATNLAREIGEN